MKSRIKNYIFVVILLVVMTNKGYTQFKKRYICKDSLVSFFKLQKSHVVRNNFAHNKSPFGNEKIMHIRLIDHYGLFAESFYLSVPVSDTTDVDLSFSIRRDVPFDINASFFWRDMRIASFNKDKKTLYICIYGYNTRHMVACEFKLTPFNKNNKKYYDIDFVQAIDAHYE